MIQRKQDVHKIRTWRGVKICPTSVKDIVLSFWSPLVSLLQSRSRITLKGSKFFSLQQPLKITSHEPFSASNTFQSQVPAWSTCINHFWPEVIVKKVWVHSTLSISLWAFEIFALSLGVFSPTWKQESRDSHQYLSLKLNMADIALNFVFFWCNQFTSCAKSFIFSLKLSLAPSGGRSARGKGTSARS